MSYFFRYRVEILVFFLLVLIVTLLHIVLLEPHLNYGFTPDDWWPLSRYKMGGLGLTWKEQGIYSTYQALYMNTLHSFFGFNFYAYQVTSIILKALSVLALFPLVLIIFKNRLLAFVTTVLYAMAFAPVGTLELVARGSDFIAIIFMCIFLIAYYYQIKGFLKGMKGIMLLTILLLFPFFLSPIRMYPLLIFILLVELYLCFLNRSKKIWMNSFKRIIFMFSPYLLVTALFSASVVSFTVNAPAIIERILIGNWQLLLYPLGSFGSLFLNDWRIFGVLETKNLTGFVMFLLINTLIIFTFITLFYIVILSIPTKRFFKFFLKVIFLNFFLDIIIFNLFKHSELINSSVRMAYDPVELYPVIFAFFIFSLCFAIYQEWEIEKRNNLLLSLWLGPVFSFIFIFWVWMFKDWSVLFKGVHTYLNIPSIGTSLFMASTVVLLYKKIKNIGVIGKYLAVLAFLLIIPIFNINKDMISHVFELNNYSMDALEHEKMRDRIWKKTGNVDTNKPAIFYFDTTGDYDNGRFYEMSVLGRFSDWVYFKGNYGLNKCTLPLFYINDTISLKQLVKEENGVRGFYFRDNCNNPHFYTQDEFFAFKLNNKEPIDIKAMVLKELGVVP